MRGSHAPVATLDHDQRPGTLASAKFTADPRLTLSRSGSAPSLVTGPFTCRHRLPGAGGFGHGHRR